MIDVFFTHYPGRVGVGHEQPRGDDCSGPVCTHKPCVQMPLLPREGDTVHLPVTIEGEPETLALKVSGPISWANDRKDNPDWYVEVRLR